MPYPYRKFRQNLFTSLRVIRRTDRQTDRTKNITSFFGGGNYGCILSQAQSFTGCAENEPAVPWTYVTAVDRERQCRSGQQPTTVLPSSNSVARYTAQGAPEQHGFWKHARRCMPYVFLFHHLQCFDAVGWAASSL